MRIWAVANQKGGVGKTTSVVALGGLLAQRGKRVLVVDLDPHGSLTSWFGYDPDTIAHSVFDLFQHQGKVPEGLPAQLITDTGCPGLSLLPASTALATLERRMIGVEGMGLIVSRALAQLWDDFDYVILDNTPSLPGDSGTDRVSGHQGPGTNAAHPANDHALPEERITVHDRSHTL